MAQVFGASSDLGHWQEIAHHYSCIFPAGTEPDASLVAEVRKVMPEFVPIFLRRVYATPEGTEQHLDFVMAGRWARTPDDPETDPVRVERPYNFPFKGGVIYAQRPLGSKSLRDQPPPKVWADRGIEDLPLKFDRGMVDWISSAYRWFMNKEAKDLKKDLLASVAAEEAAREYELKKVQDNARDQFVTELVSPGTAMDAAWAASKGPNVSVQVGA